jgi:fructose-bisphosphate aldolase, class II
MPLATPGQYARMLDAAAERRYAYAAVNVTSSETLNAALRGFQLANADGIIQITVGAGEYMSGTGANDALLGARALARYAHMVAEASPVLVALHTDHCPPAHVDDWLRPLLAESGRRVALGAVPCFTHTCSTAQRSRSQRICGSPPSCSPPAPSWASCSRPSPARWAARKTGSPALPTGATSCTRPPTTCSKSPTCSVSASAAATWSRPRSATSTGPTRPATWSCVPRSSRPGSGRSRQPIPAAASVRVSRQQRLERARAGGGGHYGVVKVNVETDNQYAFTRAIAGHVLDHWRGCSRSTVDGGQAQLRPAGVGPGRRGGDGRARQASLRATRIRGPQPRRRPVIGPPRR